MLGGGRNAKRAGQARLARHLDVPASFRDWEVTSSDTFHPVLLQRPRKSEKPLRGRHVASRFPAACRGEWQPRGRTTTCTAFRDARCHGMCAGASRWVAGKVSSGAAILLVAGTGLQPAAAVSTIHGSGFAGQQHLPIGRDVRGDGD